MPWKRCVKCFKRYSAGSNRAKYCKRCKHQVQTEQRSNSYHRHFEDNIIHYSRILAYGFIDDPKINKFVEEMINVLEETPMAQDKYTKKYKQIEDWQKSEMNKKYVKNIPGLMKISRSTFYRLLPIYKEKGILKIIKGRAYKIDISAIFDIIIENEPTGCFPFEEDD